MEGRRWITGTQVKELLGFVGVELVLISGSVISPHDPDYLAPIPVDHITKVKESWKYECSKGIEIRQDDDLLEDRLIGPHIKEGIQFWKNCGGRTPLVPLSGDDLRKAIQDFDGYLYDYATVKKYSEEIIATYRNGITPKDFVVMFKNKLAAHQGFSSKQLNTLSMRLRKRFPGIDFSDESIAQLVASAFEQGQVRRVENPGSQGRITLQADNEITGCPTPEEIPNSPEEYAQQLKSKRLDDAEVKDRLYHAGKKKWNLTWWKVHCIVEGLPYPPKGNKGEAFRTDYKDACLRQIKAWRERS